MIVSREPVAGTTNAPQGAEWKAPPKDASILLVGLGRLAPVFESCLETERVQVRSSVDPDGTRSLASRTRPDLVIVGTDRAMEPLQAMAEVRRTRPDAIILYLTPCAHAEHALDAVRHGADDVVCPPHSISRVMLRARLVGHLRNGRMSTVPVMESEERPIVVDRGSRRVLIEEREMSLTGRELELLERLLEAGGHVVARSRLLSDIWGSDQESEAVLDATVHRLRSKLEPEPTDPKVLTTVRGVGYRLESARIRLMDSHVRA